MTGVDSDDFAEHRRTWEMFLSLIRRGTLGLAVLLVLMGIFLVRH